MRVTSPPTYPPLRGSSTMPLRRPTSLARAPWRRAALAIVAVAAGATAMGAPGGLSHATPAAASTTTGTDPVRCRPTRARSWRRPPRQSNRQHGTLTTRSTRRTAARSNAAVPNTPAPAPPPFPRHCCATSMAPAASTAPRPTTARSSSHPTRDCVRATASSSRQ